jgi:hypothetical protein
MPRLPWTPTAPAEAREAGDEEAVVLASRLELRSWRSVPGFFAASMRIRRQVLSADGTLGLALDAKPLQRRFWTLSAWTDASALRRLVGTEPHVGVMRRYRPLMRSSSFATFRVRRSELPISWDRARDELRATESQSQAPAPDPRADSEPGSTHA